MKRKQKEEAFYDELIEFAFNRTGDLDSWAWSLDLEPPEASPATIAAAIGHLCKNCGQVLGRFNNLQLAGGLKFIFNNSFSDYSFALLDAQLPRGLRYHTFQSLHTLFEQCFAIRCEPVLLHGRQEPHGNPLNSVCYMFWDTSPLSTGGSDALGVMEKSLYLKNPACIESGLHGLGHAVYENKTVAQGAIDKFLKSHPKLDSELCEYALAARTGYIN